MGTIDYILHYYLNKVLLKFIKPWTIVPVKIELYFLYKKLKNTCQPTSVMSHRVFSEKN